ncbi:MAG: STAS domain-containing protein [Thermodesulfovibrionales bacterium]|nr:STAS domain-containing protein [Thermodesulfovibrionales bacterium]
MWGIVTLQGDLTIAQVPEFMQDLRVAMRVWDEIVLDIKDVNRVDVAALQMLLAAVKECEKNGKKLTIQKTPLLDGITSQFGINILGTESG